jgi:hypothetical protein
MSLRHAVGRILAVAGIAVCAITAAAGIGSASPAAHPGNSHVIGGHGLVVPVSGANSVNAACFTYTGTFRDDSNSPIGPIAWSVGPQECFGIAPSGTIWHSWPNSGGWHEMPGNGSAISMLGYQDFGPGVGKAVAVISAGGNVWCDFDDYATNTWGGWYETFTDPVTC